MYKHHHQLEMLFERLVGSADMRAEYYAGLKEGVDEAFVGERDPFEALAFYNNNAVAETLQEMVDDDFEEKDAESLASISKLGQEAHIGSLAGIDAIYQSDATVPQYEASLRKSVDAVARYIFGVAFAGSSSAGFMNLRALRNGTQPANTAQGATIKAFVTPQEPLGIDRKLSRDSLDILLSSDGQVTLKPRYDVYRDGRTGRCPVSDLRVEVDGDSRSALFTAMGVVNEVAVCEIYPRRFDVIRDAA